jgi:hydroxymethylbilane synthase
MPSSSKTIRLGTRGSKLAMWQSNWVKAELETLGCAVELIRIKTQGDVKTGPLAQIGGQGLFTKQLQVALLDESIDLAVHSLKDLPTEDAKGLSIAAIPERETTCDALCFPRGSEARSLDGLPEGACIGTGSVRRAAQILYQRPALQIKDIRGNVDTRLEKLDSGEYDAIVLAAAGLSRLGLEERISYRFDQEKMLPAVGQGALGLEIRDADHATREVVSNLNHLESFSAALAERAMLRRLFAGCLAPVGARCETDGDTLTLTGVVLSRDGKARIEAAESLSLDQYESLGISVAEKLIGDGADKLLDEAKSE